MLFSTLLLALAPGALAGMYGKPVVNLDAKTFKQALSVEHAAMVAFVAPWCGHCKALGPEYTKAAASLSPLIPFYAVDCDEDVNKPLCAQYKIQGFPTIKAFPRALKGAAKDVQVNRKSQDLIEYAKTLVPDRVKKLRADGGSEGIIDGFLAEKDNLPHVLLVHPTQASIPFLWKVLGHRLSSQVHIGYIRDTPEHAVIDSLGVYDRADTSRDPVRAVFWAKGATRDQLSEYDGEFKFNALFEWITSLVDSTPQQSRSSRSSQSTTAPPISSSTAESDAQRRARKLEEAERRDQLRREKIARAKVEAEAAAGEAVSETADAPAPQEEARSDDESGNHQRIEEELATSPEAGEAAEDLVKEATASAGRMHEEL